MGVAGAHDTREKGVNGFTGVSEKGRKRRCRGGVGPDWKAVGQQLFYSKGTTRTWWEKKRKRGPIITLPRKRKKGTEAAGARRGGKT